ncbi:murein transglycosylase A [Rickettsiales endosymbiont of Stachyamoeba lipophora]|uniref:murein transglycosylase A n=1 Tax=Rickettsiales endosymbiont of Stachyamoeba lipophora TaxID=2486578 RepID=UPI000F64885C|nr:MltA domain-containing protein [Rickettsiales endosymbiont of Stachyamoeba lipophora]AZL15429.1 murein transglycosylase [Rickettsiales endosymbiont of Stachyamoeba lipophora]
MRSFTFIFFVLLLLNSCAVFRPKETITLKPTNFKNLTGWENEQFDEFWPSLQKSCEKFLTLPSDYKLRFGSFYSAGSMADWHPLCERAEFIEHKHLQKEFLENNFTPYLVKSSKGNKGLFTGYYESDIRGSLVKTSKFKHPIYYSPPDIQERRPYYSRTEIENGVLEDRNLELLWTDDKIELFFMHIQGSGKVHLPDGSIIRIGYASQNGYPFTPIGRVLIKNNSINKSQLSAQAIKRWLRHNPEHADYVMNQNESYIFFRHIEANDGPIGALGVELTSERSIAVDKRFYPLGIPAWINTHLPSTIYSKPNKYRRLVTLQDTGGAIKGGIRADIFFGSGKRAREIAGGMKALGNIVVLLPNNVQIK